MNPFDGLHEFGIGTTKADYWVHLFPLASAPEVFWYRVDHCREYIERKKIVTTFGRSEDGTITGAGYLIPKNSYFVSVAKVNAAYLTGYNWKDMTDREFGFAGEAIVGTLMEHLIVKFPVCRVSTLRTESAQFASTDFVAEWMVPFHIEVKSERPNSSNLFVQSHEGGHRVHQVRGSEILIERITNAPPLEKGRTA